jgi:hypothetical protein
MSWRSTISNQGPLNIYEDSDTGELCVSLCLDWNKNSKYDDVTLTFEQLRRLSSELQYFVNKRDSEELCKSTQK